MEATIRGSAAWSGDAERHREWRAVVEQVGKRADQLRRIPATDVVRIEILDGNATSIPGLTGQVAIVVYTSNGASAVRMDHRLPPTQHRSPAFRGRDLGHRQQRGARLHGLAVEREQPLGADGPVSITDRDGALIESQYSKLSGKFDNPKISTAFSYDFGGDVTANLNLSYGSDFFSRKEPETAIDSAGVTRTREALVDEDGPNTNSAAISSSSSAPARLLILLERFERDNYSSTVIDRLSDDSPPRGFAEQTTSAQASASAGSNTIETVGGRLAAIGRSRSSTGSRPLIRLFELAPVASSSSLPSRKAMAV